MNTLVTENPVESYEQHAQALMSRYATAFQLYKADQLEAALAGCIEILQDTPTYFDALHLAAVLCSRLGRMDQALHYIQRAHQSNPANAVAHFNHGTILIALGQLTEAAEAMQRAVSLEPSHQSAWYHLGKLRMDLQQPLQALQHFEQAIRLNPQFVDALDKAGLCALELGQVDQAEKYFKQATTLYPEHSDFLSNYGILLYKTGRYAEAIEKFNLALRKQPNHHHALNNRGSSLLQLAQYSEAIKDFERAIQAKPDMASAYWNRALVHLLHCNFEQGWTDYEWRKKLPTGIRDETGLAIPVWTGDVSLQGRSILIFSEQGMGDTLQFCRYATCVADLGATVTLAIQAPLIPLVQTLDPRIQVVNKDGLQWQGDYQTPLMSLPYALRSFAPDEQPVSAQGYLHPSQDKIAAWKQRLGLKIKPRIGIAWSGSPKHINDLNRSMKLAQFMASMPTQLEFIALQKEIRPEDMRTLRSDLRLKSFDHELRNFEDTAALAKNLDLIVSVDTSVAHLAGAIGLPVWILLPAVPEWRWTLEGDHTDWYPTARLFRQPSIGDWQTIFAAVSRALQEKFA